MLIANDFLRVKRFFFFFCIIVQLHVQTCIDHQRRRESSSLAARWWQERTFVRDQAARWREGATCNRVYKGSWRKLALFVWTKPITFLWCNAWDDTRQVIRTSIRRLGDNVVEEATLHVRLKDRRCTLSSLTWRPATGAMPQHNPCPKRPMTMTATNLHRLAS